VDACHCEFHAPIQSTVLGRRESRLKNECGFWPKSDRRRSLMNDRIQEVQPFC
jgi:hypothetical protein